MSDATQVEENRVAESAGASVKGEEEAAPREVMSGLAVTSEADATLAGLGNETTAVTDAYGAILDRLAEQPLRRRMLFISSASAGDGVTTTAANLAGILSRTAGPVLLVEVRLTAPRLLKLTGAPDTAEGLEQGLRGAVPMADCLLTLKDNALFMLAMKTAMTMGEALHQSGPLNELLAWAEERFEWVVLDCPPVASPDWMRWFDLNADPVLLVVRSGRTRSSGLHLASQRLKGKLAGSILNDNPAA